MIQHMPSSKLVLIPEIKRESIFRLPQRRCTSKFCGFRWKAIIMQLRTSAWTKNSTLCKQFSSSIDAPRKHPYKTAVDGIKCFRRLLTKLLVLLPSGSCSPINPRRYQHFQCEMGNISRKKKIDRKIPAGCLLEIDFSNCMEK